MGNGALLNDNGGNLMGNGSILYGNGSNIISHDDWFVLQL